MCVRARKPTCSIRTLPAVSTDKCVHANTKQIQERDTKRERTERQRRDETSAIKRVIVRDIA